MQKFINFLLSRRLEQSQLRVAFLRLQLSSLLRMTSSIPQVNLHEPLSLIELRNKELYLQYVEQVLTAKEQELMSLQERLHLQAADIQQAVFGRDVLAPLRVTIQLEALINRMLTLKQFLTNYSPKRPFTDQEIRLYVSRQAEILTQCQDLRSQTETLVCQQYNRLKSQRQGLQQKLQKLCELECYEKYLNQLQYVLEQKQLQAINSEKANVRVKKCICRDIQDGRDGRDGRDISDARASSPKEKITSNFLQWQETLSRDTARNNICTIYSPVRRQQGARNLAEVDLTSRKEEIEEDSQKIVLHESGSIRKRIKIFNQRQPDDSIGQLLAKNDQNFRIPPESNLSANNLPILHQNSSFMVETPASDPPLPVFINLIPPAREGKSIVDNSVQTNLENKDKAIARLNNEKKLIRFLKLWLQYSAHFGKGNEHHHKFLYFSQWRINALFDCHILERVTQNLTLLESPLANVLNHIFVLNLGREPFTSYNELSLRKRKYAELFFDFERKVFKHTRIMIVLRSIVRNKTRKERLGIVLIFRKVFCNTQKMLLCSNYAEGALADFSQQNMGLQVRKSNLPLSIAKDLKLNSAASSFILNQSRPAHAHDHRHNKTTWKQENKATSESSLDLRKLKDYIKHQQLTQTRLVINCTRTESLLKLLCAMVPIVTRNLNVGLTTIRNVSARERTSLLERKISGCEFKWQLFIAKARVALVNNSNKISHLEQLLSLVMDN